MKPLNLLLADDDEDDRLFFEEALTEISPDSKVTIKKDGKEILDYLIQPQSVLPDIIFLDLNMPFVDGLICLEEIRKNFLTRDIFVVINTTTASQREIDLVFEKGANLFLIKPNSFDELKKSIEVILNLDLNIIFRLKKREHFVFNLTTFSSPGFLSTL